jgi:hypothetical protein
VGGASGVGPFLKKGHPETGDLDGTPGKNIARDRFTHLSCSHGSSWSYCRSGVYACCPVGEECHESMTKGVYCA